MLHLIRHTRVDIPTDTCYGQLDVPLKTPYQKPFESIQHKLKKQGVDPYKIISSPLQRCTTLARFLSPHFTTDRVLMEIYFGEWEGKKWREIPLEKTKKWTDDILNQRPPNGENYWEFRKRVVDFYNEKILPNKQETIVLITHAGVIRCLRSHIEKIDAFKSLNLKIPYGSVLKITF